MIGQLFDEIVVDTASEICGQPSSRFHHKIPVLPFRDAEALYKIFLPLPEKSDSYMQR